MTTMTIDYRFQKIKKFFHSLRKLGWKRHGPVAPWCAATEMLHCHMAQSLPMGLARFLLVACWYARCQMPVAGMPVVGMPVVGMPVVGMPDARCQMPVVGMPRFWFWDCVLVFGTGELALGVLGGSHKKVNNINMVVIYFFW